MKIKELIAAARGIRHRPERGAVHASQPAVESSEPLKAAALDSVQQRVIEVVVHATTLRGGVRWVS